MTEKQKIKYSEDEFKKLSMKSTHLYFKSVMQKIFREKWSQYLEKLLSGDRATLDTCAAHLSKNLDFFPLLHTLCLVSGQKHDLNEKDHTKAADAWLCWYADNKGQLEWDTELEHWIVKK
jgi:hypothetical protein